MLLTSEGGCRKEEKERRRPTEVVSIRIDSVQLTVGHKKGALHEHRAYKVRHTSKRSAHLVQAALSQLDEQAKESKIRR